MRQNEALAGLARSAVEATLLGLYSIVVDDEDWERRLARQNAEYGKRTMQPLDTDGALVGALFDDIGDLPGMPNLRQVAQRVDQAMTFQGDPIAEQLYLNYHVPLSNLCVHTTLGGLSLYRSPFGTRRRRPLKAVPRRGVVRCVEACAAFLAAAIADRRGSDPAWFVGHGHDQLRRAEQPIPILGLRIALRSIPAHLIAAALSREVRADLVELTRLLHSDAFRSASSAEQMEMLGRAARALAEPVQSP